MEQQLPSLPVEEGKEKLKSSFQQVNDSPSKMLGVMVVLSVLISLIFFGFLYLSQNLDVSQSKKAQDQAQEPKDSNQVDGKAQDQQRRQDLQSITHGLRSYKVNYGNYPTSLENLVPEFLYKIPLDPATKKQYDYRLSVDRKSFEIKARLSSGDELSQTED